jgi:aspartyl-tRNA(Asn)/glutamyl-tRNA(Gln) amidotransferase subunit A
MHEFALGTTSHVSHFGAVHNPWHTDYISGGSSGGSAVAVAAGMCYAAIGTDTGGSNRLPAASCNVVGLKPSFALISTNGIIPAIQSLDHSGVFARTVEDAALVLNVVADLYPGGGKLSLKPSVPRLLNIGIVQNFKASDEVTALFHKAMDVFQNRRYQLSPIVLPELPEKLDFIDAELKAFHEPLVKAKEVDYSPEMAKWIKELPSIDASLYLQQKVEMEKRREKIATSLFSNIDVLMLPTTTAAPVTLEEAKVTGAFAWMMPIRFL